MEQIMYRSEDSLGSGVRDIIDVMTYEIYELRNPDILDYVFEHYEFSTGLSNDISAYLYALSDDVYYHMSKQNVQNLCTKIVDEINKKTKHNLKFALWLADRDVVADMYADDELNIDAYYTSDVILSDLGYDGKLFAYDEEPEPIDDINESKLNENFRDYDSEISKLEDELYNLITSVDMFSPDIDILNYEFNDNFYDEDIQKGKQLQQRIKKLYDLQKAEYNQEIKDLPPETSKTDFEGFDITKTDPPFDEQMIKGSKDRDYIMKKYGFTDVYIAEMTPDEYLLLCGKYGWGKQFDNVDDIYNNGATDKTKVKEYVERFKNGEKAPMPVLNVYKQGQEGRHRAFAAKLAGIKTIPVLIEV